MGVTQGMVAVVVERRLPEVVDRAAPVLGEDARHIEVLPPAPLVRVVPGQQQRGDRVQPVQRAGGAHASLVEARYGSGGRQVADDRLDRLQPAGADGFDVCKRALAEALAGKEVAHDLGKPVEGQQLVFAQIHDHALDARSILHGGRRRAERRQGQILTST